jgi:poly(A) polymerase
MRFMDAQRMKASTLKRFFRLERLRSTWRCTDGLPGRSGTWSTGSLCASVWQAMPEEAVRPKPLITGRELIAAGYPPGRGSFKEMLRAVEDAQLEGTSRDGGRSRY